MMNTNDAKTGMISKGVALCALAAALLWGCALNGEERPEMPERQRVIVNFRLSEGAGKTRMREMAARILSRLNPGVRKTARTFELLPLIALEADAGTLMELIRIPEVESVQADRAVKLFGSSGMAPPVAPSGATKR